jgi:hypothetical protein
MRLKDKFACEFAEWILTVNNVYLDQKTIQELLEQFKKK